MGQVKCVFNSVNGANTGAYTRFGMGKSHPSAGVIMKKNCPGGFFYIDNSVGGTNNYYKIINPDSYGLNSGGKTVYAWISSSYLTSPSPSSVKTATTTVIKQTTTAAAPPSATTNVSLNPLSPSRYSKDLDDKIYSMLKKSYNFNFETSSRIMGTPYQFLNETDYRPYADDGIDIGRKYIENILLEAPILYLVPGLPDYMPDVTNKEALDGFIKARYNNKEISDTAMAAILKEDGRYFDFISAYAEYVRYVNLLCRVCSVYMGIQDRNVPGTQTPYKNYDWGNWTNASYKSDMKKQDSVWDASAGKSVSETIIDDVFGDYKYIKCYVDPATSFRESASNNTQQSQVAGLFDTMEGIVREVGFFSKGSLLDNAVDLTTGTASDVSSSIRNALDSDTSSGLSKIMGMGERVLEGSNIIFPELWGDSSYSKSYDVTVSLVSPYGDPESIYLNIIVPMMHLIAVSMPRQTSANSFGAPFLVKGFCKGWFSCDLGIVDSISIEKGGSGDAWTVIGLPNEVKVTMSIRDLYTNLMITKSSEPALFFNNQGLIDFLAVTCGVNITRSNFYTKINTLVSTFVNSLFDVPSNVYDSVIQEVRNKVEPLFKLTR